MRRVNILGVEISAVNKETAIQYLLENMDRARGRYICACNVHTTVTAHENLDYQVVQNNSFMTLPDGKPLPTMVTPTAACAWTRRVMSSLATISYISMAAI